MNKNETEECAPEGDSHFTPPVDGIPQNKNDAGIVYFLCAGVLFVIILGCFSIVVFSHRPPEINTFSDGGDIYNRIVYEDVARKKAEEEYLLYSVLRKILTSRLSSVRRPKNEDLDEHRPVDPPKGIVRPYTNKEE